MQTTKIKNTGIAPMTTAGIRTDSCVVTGIVSDSAVSLRPLFT